MSAGITAAIRAAVTVTLDEDARRKLGWVLAAILAPVILLAAFLCALGSGAASHNLSAVELCFYGGTIPADAPEEYRACIEEMRSGFARLDAAIGELRAERADGLDEIRVKAAFYALYFGADSPGREDCREFVECFVAWEERTRIVTVRRDDGTVTEREETYTAAVPLEDLEEIFQNIRSAMGVEVTEEQRGNADSIYRLVRYGYTGDGAIFEGAGVPFIGADGFCSPIGENWRSVVTSEFGYRSDPFTGETRGHTGMDLAVPTGTPIRAALLGTVTVSAYDRGGYGYYVMIDHGDGLVTLYGHCSQLLASVGRTVEAGDVIALSGSTGRSTGPHLHFEVRVNGQRTNPRGYLP